jgi:hypothetical protein
MIACSSLVNETIQKNAQLCGFDRVIEAPLSSEKIKSIIDQLKLKEKVHDIDIDVFVNKIVDPFNSYLIKTYA